MSKSDQGTRMSVPDIQYMSRLDLMKYVYDLEAQRNAALRVARDYSQIDGDWHKAWSIDQMVRALTGDDYEAWVAQHNDGEEGPNTYSWDVGIAP